MDREGGVNVIEVKNLVKKYGGHVAVDHLNFTVEKGQIYGFLGPNGAGKSTTMNIMTGYIGATEGEVLINGHNILTEPEEAKKSIGYLPEIPPLYMDMTVTEYLNFAAEIKKIKPSRRAKAVMESIKMTQLESVQNRLIRNLSKGYKQRVGLAQAIMGLPDIIILDEPTVGLDPKQIIEIRDLIKKLANGRTIILSSHILSEVSAICDHIMIISKGNLVASDTPENLLKLMEASHCLELLVKAEQKQVEEILNGIENPEEIADREVKEGTQPGTTSIRIQASVKEDGAEWDVREELFYLFADSRCPILMMQSSKVSLEDVFMELTSEDAAEKAKMQNVQPGVSDQYDGEITAEGAEKQSQEEDNDAGSL